jgi:DNA-binding response OmpR family regulator
MSVKRILLADNNVDFLDALAESLERSGYEVLKASNPDSARRILDGEWVHLAILDNRLTDDLDPNDFSGIALAKDSNKAVPKIILTAYQTWQAVREAMGTMEEETPPAIYFVSKQEELDLLPQYIQRAFEKHVRINWDLQIEWKERERFSIVDSVEQDLDPKQVTGRADELEDLFRRLFYDKDRIKIERRLWEREGRMAFSVFAFKEGKPPDSLVVVCGRNPLVVEESRRYLDFAPKAPGPTATVLTGTSETTHFAADTYNLAGADLENIRSLFELYRTGPEKAFNACLKTLFEKTLADWHQGKRILDKDKSLDDWYRERCDLNNGDISPSSLRTRIDSLLHHIPALGTRMELDSGNLHIHFNWQSFSYTDPGSVIFQKLDLGEPVLLINTPGELFGDNIFTDPSEQVWMTDFSCAGLSPLLWNFIALEAAVRFDWLETTNLQWIHDMELLLTAREFTKLQMSDVEAPLRRTVKTVQTIRLLASKTMGKNPSAYHMGILFQAVRRLLKFDPSSPPMMNKAAQLAHALMAAAMISSQIAQQNRQSYTNDLESEETGIRIDKANRTVWVDGLRVPLRGHSYDLLVNLYDRPNQLVTRRELIEEVFDERYHDTDESQSNRLSMAIYRLRDKIEEDPNSPKYLLTDPAGGYRLVLHF